MALGLDDQQLDSQLEAREVQGDKLLSLAVHELRSPLSVVKWYTEMILDGDCGLLNDDQAKCLRTIQTSNQRAIDLLKSLLNVSRLDLGTFGINPIEVNLSLLIKQVLTEYQLLLVEKKLVVEEVYEEDNLPVLMADKQMSLVILRNLISNAILFSKEGGSVKIQVSAKEQASECAGKKLKEDSLLISITDAGIGIPETDKAKIFSKFFRASNAGSNGGPKGAGLGLHVVQSILKATGGEVWFNSTKDIGSTFYLALPKSGMLKKEGQVTLD